MTERKSGDDSDPGETWLAAELNRIWLVAERALRAFQKAQIRPASNHPSMAEVEITLAARRSARYGRPTEPEDEATLARSIAQVEAQLGTLRKSAVLGQLSASLNLRPLEIETLMAVVAPHLDAPLADIFTILRGTSGGRRGVDLALITTLFRLRRSDRVALLDVLDPERPLVYWRLIQILPGEALESFGSMSHRALRPTFDLISTLCRESALAPELGRSAKLVTASADINDLSFDPEVGREVLAMCDAARNDVRSASKVPWLVFYGPVGSGKREVASRIAAYGGRPLVTFDPSTVIDRNQFDDMFLRIQREAMIRNAALYIGPLTTELQVNGGRELLRRLEHFAGPVVIGVDGLEPPRLVSSRPLWELGLRLLSEPLRAKLWDKALPAEMRAADVNVPNIARAFNLTPGEINLAAQEAVAIARHEGVLVDHAGLRECVGRRLRNDLGEFAKPVSVSVTWADLVLPQDHMDRVHEFIARRKYSDRVYNEWGYGKRVGYGKGLIALFSGPPGTGKTMLAGLIARALDLDMYQVDLAQVVSKWVGETEKQLAKVFDQAERAHAVLLFDEADSLFAKRTEVKSSNDRYGNMATNYLLQRLEQYSGVAVLTTNKDASLDEALQRRLSLHLFLEIPEVEERERLWRSFMPERAPVLHDVDYHQLAQEFRLSGGYIKNAAVRAAFLAASHDAPISMELLRVASALELEDMGHVVFHRTSRIRHVLGAELAPRPSARWPSPQAARARDLATVQGRMFKRILIASDLTEQSSTAVSYARQLAVETGASIIALHVVAMPVALRRIGVAAPRSDAESYRALVARQLATSEPVLRAQLEKARVNVARARVLVRAGLPALVIAEVVDELDIDLIVVGRGRGGRLGPVAEHTVRLVGRTVMVVPVEKKRRARRGLPTSRRRPLGRLRVHAAAAAGPGRRG